MENTVGSIDEGILFTLKYFGLFKYPLEVEEIHPFNPFPCTFNQTMDALEKLVSDGKIYKISSFYACEKNADWVSERLNGNNRAYRLLNHSRPYVSIIASFPFIRGIAFSGSLSKFYASEQADMDFFIVTESNRLWIARTLLHTFKKLTFLTGHQHYFCMNYFVDKQALSIVHRNYYSAVELATLLPAYKSDVIKNLFEQNEWLFQFLPNHPGVNNLEYHIQKGKQPFKKAIEMVFNLLFPRKLNTFLMNLTDRKWRHKWKKGGYDMKHYDKAFLTTTHISKNHPVDYEKIVLDSMEKKTISI